MKIIQFTPNMENHKELIQLLQENKVVGDNNFDSRGDTLDENGNVIQHSDINTYHFSEWFDSMEQLTAESIQKAKVMFADFAYNRLLPEWYYDLKIHKNGQAVLEFHTDSIAIDVSDSGPYEYILTPVIEPYLKERIETIFQTLTSLGFSPSWA